MMLLRLLRLSRLRLLCYSNSASLGSQTQSGSGGVKFAMASLSLSKHCHCLHLSETGNGGVRSQESKLSFCSLSLCIWLSFLFSAPLSSISYAPDDEDKLNLSFANGVFIGADTDSDVGPGISCFFRFLKFRLDIWWVWASLLIYIEM